MKTISYFTVLLLMCIKTYAQFGPQQIITDQAHIVEFVIAVDIDGDGDMDIASASTGSHTIAWQENIDGLGSFGPQQVITDTLASTMYVYASDLDGDGDMDILALAAFEDLIVWFENTDGLGSFGSQRIISTVTDLPLEIVTADLDGDGDMDVISASRDDSTVAWFENLDGLGNFGPIQVISNTAINVFSVYAADLDGDGDMDVIGTSNGSKRLYWYENLDGLGSFGAGQIIVETTEFVGFVSVFAIDIDGDNDYDILSAEFGGSSLSWYENTDGLGTFGPRQIITATLDTPFMVFSIDLDDDGDPDVLSSSAEGDKVVWFENMDGLGTFGLEQVITTLTDGPWSVYAADLDGDGDNDVISAALIESTIAWYENLTILNVPENKWDAISIYPNPVSDILNITTPLSNYSIEVFTIQGQLISTPSTYSGSQTIDYSNYASGIYLMKLTSESASKIIKIMKE